MNNSSQHHCSQLPQNLVLTHDERSIWEGFKSLGLHHQYVDMMLMLQASPLTVLLFAPYPQPCGASDKEQKKALVERPINVHENP